MSKRNLVASTLVVLVLTLGIVWLLAGPKIINRVVNATINPGMNSTQLGLGTYPVIEESQLSRLQRNIVTLARREHADQPDYLKYSEGNREAWCADFASWIMHEAGAPYRNPNSGQWRIPGTLTLREYYEAEKRFKSIDSGYVPKVGDVVLYDGAGWFGQHVNIVLKNENGKLTTVGGNEKGKIRVQTNKIGTRGAIEYGVLASA